MPYPRRAESVTNTLLGNTVLNKWFQPMEAALSKVRFSDKVFPSLPMASFLLMGGLRQILSIETLREQVQTLFHLDANTERLPLARSTWSDALKSIGRCDIHRQAIEHLIKHAQNILPNKLDGVEDIGNRSVIAVDATYQNESSHFYPVFPKDGGCDNTKKHMLMTYYDIRHGIPLNMKVETSSMGEMRVFEADCNDYSTDWGSIRNAIYVVDRAFIKGSYWDNKKTKFKSSVITRMKSTLNYSVLEGREVSSHISNESVLSDQKISLNSSKQSWRLIKWVSPDGVEYEYLSNDFSLEPGVIAFLYLRRWDEEKYFDNFKNDLANSKAWGKSAIAIEQQSLMGMMSYLLTRLFVHDCCRDLGLDEGDGDGTQKNKQDKKVKQYLDLKELKSSAGGDGSGQKFDEDYDELLPQYDAYRAFYSQLSKITRQVWRFLKYCFKHKSTPELYEKQLQPLLERYL